MWKARQFWFAGASEPPWTVAQAFVLFVLTPISWVAVFTVGQRAIRQADGPDVRCPPPVAVFIHGWARAWTLVYFNQPIRDALATLFKVFTCLGPLFALCLLRPGHPLRLRLGPGVGVGVGVRLEVALAPLPSTPSPH
jgi:hypothetical protein